MAKRHEALIPLSHDHQKALGLAFRLLHPSPPGPETPTTPSSTPGSRRAEVLDFFASHLVGHFAIEEELLFPALRDAAEVSSSARRLLDELCEEHIRMRDARNAIEATTDELALAPLLEAFGTLLERHVRREERELFVDFPGSLEPERAEELRVRIHARRPPDTPGAGRQRR